MRIGIAKETLPNETLVAATPDTVKKLQKLGYEVVVERTAGQEASYPDSMYEQVAEIVDKQQLYSSDIVIKINQPTPDEVQLLKENSYLVSKLAPANNEQLLQELSAKSVTAIAMDAIPRISRAQSMDILSSQANLAGYRAVVEAANEFGRLFSGQVTAAGKVAPARVYVVGAGIAGLAAIGTAVSMGAEVYASDVRPEVAEQVNSMGATFVPLIDNSEVSADGYAREMTGDQQEVAAKVYDEQVAKSDIVITTALIPGKPAPRIVSRETLQKMKPGSVVVDMATVAGGNVEGSEADQVVVTENGVKILGSTNFTAKLANQASQLYGNNVANLFALLTPDKDGQIVLDFDDVIIRSATVTKGDEITWPPPPVTVSATVQNTEEKAQIPVAQADLQDEHSAKKHFAKLRNTVLILVAIIGFYHVASANNGMMVTPLTVFILAIIIGYYVISKVTHALHTPLMSVTNAISGVVLIGAMLQIGSSNPIVTALSFIAIVVASINIFGGFVVTDRMLSMFKKGK